jgi:hypothetical protein
MARATANCGADDGRKGRKELRVRIVRPKHDLRDRIKPIRRLSLKREEYGKFWAQDAPSAVCHWHGIC